MRRFIAVVGLALALGAPATARAWTWPTDGAVLRPFSLGSDPYAGGQHRGIDIGGGLGAKVRATAGGKITFAGTVPKVSESDVVVFATEPTGEVRSWRWRYVGKLAGGAEARELGGVGVTQIDLARGVDGQLLLVTSPDDWNTGMQDFVHYGCRVTEVESIDPPKLARDSAGRLKVRATITASDTMPLGPGACTYDQASATGVLLVRRHKERGLMTASIHSTGMRP